MPRRGRAASPPPRMPARAPAPPPRAAAPPPQQEFGHIFNFRILVLNSEAIYILFAFF